MPFLSRRTNTPLLRFGMFLLFLNMPFGYGALALSGVTAGITGNADWLRAGLGCYAISWCMLGLGLCLAGKSGYHAVRTGRHRRRRLRKLRILRSRRPCPPIGSAVSIART